MTIDEAIKIKEQYHEKYRVHMLSQEREADNLSIEALKFRQDWEEQVKEFGFILLPGETEE